MLFVPPTISALSQTNISSSTLDGIIITASATPHSKGLWTSIINPTGKPSYGVIVDISGVFGSNTNTSMLVDIAIADPGGGNEEIIIPNLNAWGAPDAGSVPRKTFHFPGLYVPAGVQVSARCQSVIGSDTARIIIWLGQDAPFPMSVGKVAAYGDDESTSHGTSVTPGTDTFGTWTAIGTTVRAHRVWTFGMDLLTDTSLPSNSLPWVVEIGFGPSSTEVTPIGGPYHQKAASNEQMAGPMPPYQYAVVPRGTKLWMRFAVDNGTEARGVIIYGMD